jgi:hypothetical protein
MDDTLCKYDTEKRLRHCAYFEPKADILDVARVAKKHGYDIVIATARPHYLSFATRTWLRKHGVDASAVYLRNGQLRNYKAADVKVKMFEDILEKWEVEAFYDDSPFTIEAAQQIGVNAVFVPGNEEYWAIVGG